MRKVCNTNFCINGEAVACLSGPNRPQISFEGIWQDKGGDKVLDGMILSWIS